MEFSRIHGASTESPVSGTTQDLGMNNMPHTDNDSLPVLSSEVGDGTISLCPHNGCNFTCCDFSVGNYIVLYPGELDAAREQGLSIDHLEISDGHRGGHRAICCAKDCTTCDEGYKPLDCASYPFFPTINDAGEIEAGIKGSKCPLQATQVPEHRNWVVQMWSELSQHVSGLIPWIRDTRLVGYERVE